MFERNFLSVFFKSVNSFVLQVIKVAEKLFIIPINMAFCLYVSIVIICLKREKKIAILYNHKNAHDCNRRISEALMQILKK